MAKTAKALLWFRFICYHANGNRWWWGNHIGYGYRAITTFYHHHWYYQ